MRSLSLSLSSLPLSWTQIHVLYSRNLSSALEFIRAVLIIFIGGGGEGLGFRNGQVTIPPETLLLLPFSFCPSS